MKEMIFSGFGGQGILTAGSILAETVLKAGKRVTWLPSYGSEMRGGTANCTVKVSDAEIASPYANRIDFLIAMNDASVEKFQAQVNPGGYMFVNTSVCSIDNFRDDINVVLIPANDIALENNNPKGANVVVLGAVFSALGDYEVSFVKECLDNYFSGKSEEIKALNGTLLKKGFDCFEDADLKGSNQ